MCFWGCDHEILSASLAQSHGHEFECLTRLTLKSSQPPLSPTSYVEMGILVTSILKVERYITSSIVPLRALSYTK